MILSVCTFLSQALWLLSYWAEMTKDSIFAKYKGFKMYTVFRQLYVHSGIREQFPVSHQLQRTISRELIDGNDCS